jgi:hypothetical protein
MRQDKISVALEDREKPGLRTQVFLKCVRVALYLSEKNFSKGVMNTLARAI